MIPLPSPRRGSALILIMAILTLTAVLAFGTLAFVNDQRGWARTKHTDALIHQALLSGRAHAQRIIEQAYLDARAGGQPTLIGQAWTSAFAATGGTWPSPASDPIAANRQSARQALADGTWGQNNAWNLWRFEPGLASPIVRPDPASPHGQDDGFCSHDGTGRWFTIAWLDRNMQPVPQAQASLQLRYAVAAVDLSGLILGNKVRYQHLTAGSRLSASYLHGSAPRTAAAGNPVAGDLYAVTASRDDVPTTGVPCPQTDIPLGRNDDSLGCNQIYYNSWRPIPVDHTYTAHMLISVGCGLDDSTPRTLSDSATQIGARTINGKTNAYVQRVLGSLPDAWRDQGYLSVTLNYWQYSRRFGDFLPFDQNPQPVTSGDPYHTSNGSGKVLAGYANNYTLPAGSLPPLLDRHPAALLINLQNDTSNDPLGNPLHQFPGDPYDYALDKNGRRLGEIWNQIDFANWLGLQQALRLHRIAAGTTAVAGLPNLPSKADGMTQCWSPFGSSIGRFADRGANDLRRKNDWEMRYQWTPDANTAPAQVLANIIRLAVPADTSGHSAESLLQADRDAYEASIQALAAQVATARPYLTPAALIAAATAWSADPPTQRMLQSCTYGGDGTALQPADLGLGAGPRAEFAVAEWNTTASPYVVIQGRHVKRFWSAVAVIDRADAAYRLRGWSAGSPGSTPDLWVQTNVALAGAFGAEYVSGSPGSWTPDANGTFTRVWIDPASGSNINPAADRVIAAYPGITLSVGLSHWFRVAVRAELHDLDVPQASKDLSMDLVLHLDPDASGNVAGTSGLWDGDIPYCDLENAVQWRTSSNDGSIIW